MPKVLALFPLSVVVYPGDKLNLHIFEPRYKQLVQDCTQNNITFGIPPFLDNIVQPYGTEMKLIEIEKRYPDGKMDIRTQAIRVFRTLDFFNPLVGKFYSGGEVEFLPMEDTARLSEKLFLIESAQELFEWLKIEMPFSSEEQFLSFKIAPKAGLTLAQAYELLQTTSESQRIAMLIAHITKTIPVLKQMELTKEIIRQNGHFRHYDSLDF